MGCGCFFSRSTTVFFSSELAVEVGPSAVRAQRGRESVTFARGSKSLWGDGHKNSQRSHEWVEKQLRIKRFKNVQKSMRKDRRWLVAVGSSAGFVVTTCARYVSVHNQAELLFFFLRKVLRTNRFPGMTMPPRQLAHPPAEERSIDRVILFRRQQNCQVKLGQLRVSSSYQ